MSDYTIIYNISETLLKLLKDNMNGLISSDHISLVSPAEIEVDTDPRLSLFLYQIVENEHLKNQNMPSVNTTMLQYPPLPVNLFYLLTAYASALVTEHQILGRVMQIFYDNRIIRGSLLQGSLSETFEELKVVLHPFAIEDMNKLWNMFGNKPYKLSVVYKVSTAMIDSTREIEVERVIKHRINYHRQT